MNQQSAVNNTESFVRTLSTARHFADAFEESAHAPVPDDWMVAVTDVVRSRDQIAKGRYKAVNMAGVAMISAAMNALGSRELPYAFGGDGAVMALAPREAEALNPVLASLVTMAQEELELELRAALVPVSRIRSDGFDVRIRPVRVSEAITNYAFSGGGISHSEKLMKAGEYRVARAAPGSRPDLTGQSCRWTPVSAKGRSIVSLIVERGEAADAESFSQAVRQLLGLLGMEGDGGSPIPSGGPHVGWPVSGAELEARATHGKGSLPARRIQLFFATLFAFLLFRTGIKVGGFDPAHYQAVTGLNTDFRKVQDGLRMTVSMTAREQERLETFLELKRSERLLRYGLSIQESALLTCYAPSVMDDSHFHFLDGAGGGYAAAAAAMRA